MKTKKKLLFAVIMFVVAFVPVSIVYAEDYSVSLSCDSSVSVTGSANCSISVNAPVETLKSVVLSVGVSGSCTFDVDPSNTYSAGPYAPATDHLLATFQMSQSTPGSCGISLTTSATKDDGMGGDTPLVPPVDPSVSITFLDNNATLTALKLNEASLGGFSPTNYGPYSYNTSASSINLTSNHAGNVIVYGEGDKGLVCGNNSFSLDSHAEDGSTLVYTINIVRNCNTNTNLGGLSLSSGSLSPSFNASTTTYSVTVESSVTSISITPTKANDTQSVTSVSGASLRYGSNTFTIRVTSEAGGVKTYTINVTRKDDRSVDANLSTLTLSSGKIKFDPNITEYNVKVLNDVTSLTVTPTAAFDKATVVVTGGEALVEGLNVITIVVTPENGDAAAAKTYTINVTRLLPGETLGDNPLIESIKIDGYDFSFSSEKYNYTLKIEKDKALNIRVKMQEETATYTIKGNSDLKNGSVVTIITTSESGETATYKITIEKDNNLLLYVGIGVLGVALIIGIIFLVKKIIKKNKENPKTEKPSTKDDKILLDKINSQIKNGDKKDIKTDAKTEVKTDVKTDAVDDKTRIMETIKPIKVVPDSDKTRIVEEKNPVKEEPKKDNISTAPKVETLKEEPKKETLKEEKTPAKDEDAPASDDKSATKICSICGHRVSATAKICPYCRRIWN